MKKTQQQIRDDAYLKSQQIDLETQAIPSIETSAPTHVDGVPDTCPRCTSRMTPESGWTCLAATTAGHGVLCCGHCGHSISVESKVFETYRGILRKLADDRAAKVKARKPKPREGRRTRGAG